MVSMSVSDDESDTPFSASLSGSDLELVYSKIIHHQLDYI